MILQRIAKNRARWRAVLDVNNNDNEKSRICIYFEITDEIEHVETIAVGGKIRDIMRLRKQDGVGRGRKLKGIGKIRLQDGRICKAELHWYEAHGIGRKKMKIKRLLY